VKANIYSHRQLIGSTDLKVGDETMGGVFGDFIPTEEYFKSVQKSVWDFWQTSKPDYEKWYSLRLNIQLENGIFLFPQGGYTIDDIRELPEKSKRIDIAGIDNNIIKDFLLTNPPRPFVEEPWNALEIEQKIAFEDELKKKLGRLDRSFFNFLNKPTRHVLFDTEFSAFCYDQRNGDVLFEFKKPNFDKQFALVHLTWTSKKEKEGYPNTTFYSDFDDFKYSKMYNDKAEWED
jgi:hypothetical protein